MQSRSFNFTLFFALLIFVSNSIFAQVDWEKHPSNPVLGAAMYSDISGSFDLTFAFSPTVIEENGNYRMWHTGYNGYSFSIGEALSTDGVRWYSYRGNPILKAGYNDGSGLRVSSVIKDKDGYKMYYYTGSGYYLKICLATSIDGINWIKQTANPILLPGAEGGWDDVGVWSANVICENGKYKMWYQGYDGMFSSIGYAYSDDGINWVKYSNNPVLLHGNDGEFDYLTAGEPRVIHNRGRYHMFYTSTNIFIRNQIGYAWSKNGIQWYKYSNNPVLSWGKNLEWDGMNVTASAVIVKDKKFHLWYSARGANGIWQIGYASSKIKEGQFIDTYEVVSEANLKGFTLNQNYPNPFNPTTEIRFEIPTAGKVTLTVYDVLGSKVASLVDNFLDAGWHNVIWGGTNYESSQKANGIYFYRIDFKGLDGTFTSEDKKMIFLK